MIALHNGNDIIELLTNDDSYSYEAIKGEDTLTLYFSHPGYLNIPVGSWCEFYGKRYSLKKDSNFKKNGERNYEYTLVLETAKADAGLWKIRNTVDNRIKFPYTAKPKEHLKLIVDNLNRRSSGWVIGECIEGTEKLINYNHTYALDGLNQLAETYETEWQIKETVIEGVHTKTVHLRKVEYNKDNPLVLSYGKGHGFKVGVGRESGDVPPEIILVETTDRNIDYSKYGAKELLMPKSQTIRYDGTHFEGEEGFNSATARTYKTDEYGTAVMRADRELSTGKEDSLDCTEIYPSRVGEVSEVIAVTEKDNTFYDFKDKDIPESLDFSRYRIDGEKATIIFQSGMLSGKEFDLEQTDKKLTGYVHGERRFKLVSQEIDGITMPDGGVWMPKVGDKYAVFGIQLPEAYICDNTTKTGASWEVFKTIVKYLYEHENKEFTFTGTLDGIWAKKRWLQIGGKIVLGGFVNFTDVQFHPDGSLIRMTGIKRYVNNPYSPEIELSNSPVGTSISSELNKIETNEVQVDENHKKALQFTKRYYRDAKETMDMLADSLLNFSGAINPITVATMQMLVGDESLQFRFVNSKTNPVVVNHDISYNSSTKVLNAPAGILQHMTLGVSTLCPTHAVSDYKFWDMAEYNSPSLIEPEKKFFLYAKCSKDNQSGTFLLSETAIGMEQIESYYHFLVGILNSENSGARSFATVYGFTEILPGRITTDKIVSTDGNTYFDLLKGIIGGKITFTSGSSGLKNLNEWGEVSEDISAAQTAADKANTAVSDLGNYVDGAFADGIITEAEAKAIEKYINMVNNTKSAVEATYNKLYVNTYLEGTPKTNLLNAKVTLFGEINNLISSINTAIADGKTTAAEKNDVDNKFSAFNSALASFNTAVEAASKAIQDKLKTYSDEITQDLKNSLGKLAYSDLVSLAKLDETIIEGGFIKTSLVNAKAIITSRLIADAIRSNTLNVANKFIVYRDGTTLLNGSTRTPFKAGTFSWGSNGGITVSTDGLQNNNNVIIPGDGGGWAKSISIPFSMDYDGFEAIILNDDFDGQNSNSVISASAPTGGYFYENGVAKNTLDIHSKQGVKMIGITNGSSFRGWLITQRFNTTGYGRLPLIVAQGTVIGTSSGATISYKTFDNKKLIVTRSNIGIYWINFATNGWFSSADEYIVMVTGLGYSSDYADCPIKGTITRKDTKGFVVETSDDSTRNDGSFMFQLINLNSL